MAQGNSYGVGTTGQQGKVVSLAALALDFKRSARVVRFDEGVTLRLLPDRRQGPGRVLPYRERRASGR
jgi:hypothetical protein